MKVHLAQINTTPRAFEENVNQIKFNISKAQTYQSDLVVFPELSIPGYLVQDLMYNPQFVDQNLFWLHDIVNFSKDYPKLHIIVGYIDYNRKGIGKPFKNMAAVILNGKIIATYQKQLLPFYDVFDEGRYFEPGDELTVIEIKGIKWGLAICEDLWNDKEVKVYNYKNNPVQKYKEIGINNIISINSSPFAKTKNLLRWHMLDKIAKDNSGIIIYVNQLGNQDELIFNGNSLVLSKHGILSCATQKDFQSVNIPTKLHTSCISNSTLSILTNDNVLDNLILGLRDYLHKNNFKSVVVGSSGGIDSAVVLSLASVAIGSKNVTGIRMPSQYSSDHSKSDAKRLHENLTCHDKLIAIEDMLHLQEINQALDLSNYNSIADENIQARQRGQIIMHYSNATGAMALATGNKTELALGYCTIYGDMAGGFAPISDLYKLEVYELARLFNEKFGETIPQNIINKAPSAELAPNQKDEDSLLPYYILDLIVKLYIEHFISNFSTWVNVVKSCKLDDCYIIKQSSLYNWIDSENSEKKYNQMIAKIDMNEFKRRQAAPGLKISSVAFGSGRRIPITKGKML